jgi:signal transduction histidine kinase
MVNVLATYGYKPGELPEGTDGKKWPADRGIIKRVIRTLQPDLAPDVRIDPDYTPSLTGALSQMTLPMMSGGELIAMLVLETNKEPRFNLLDLTFVQRIAEHASVSVANAQLLRELQFAAETKSEFVGFAAHELKNPLASVKGYAGLLNNRSMLAQMSEEMRNDAITRILTNADRMESIINDLRDVAAIDANKLKMELQPISFYKVVEDTLMTFDQRLEEKDQKVQNLVSPDLPLVLGDHQRLLQVMTNLVSNAHKYSDEGKTITIRADVNRSFRTRQGQLLGAVLHVKVIDEGIGMDESDLSRIFREDYFRSDNEKARAQKGTGLGMMITQRFVEGHGGRIWVESQIGVGSVFQFVVPLAPDVPKPEEPVTGVQFEDYRAPTQHSNGRKTEPNMAAEHQPASD